MEKQANNGEDGENTMQTLCYFLLAILGVLLHTISSGVVQAITDTVPEFELNIFR